MIGERIDGPGKLDEAKEAVQAATQTVKETTQSVADAVEAGRQPRCASGPLGSLGSRSAPARSHRRFLGRCSARAPR